ncbi:hypothetical protein D8B26_006571 [Coccidioides posadasii str. Silveira]|uniref:Uncharacterized protein n=2 Tax=Coccidioides posadasii TaxID=199306 RepID=E9CU01_COCPS|nr:hypothetical protein CPC735_027090 [Coccidioides posadasii C735 delta SOWgp]EER27373.1 hypothetical protein CPC735_027090 [Coccidioides posadasii C735 delta SOWgp]EFW23037.1 conserved hypothetical protein [Coccidioides posadasii str. Silveira]QVM11932.1 hypothetical protein D8B26_006571 [Coccidioides posadasii str. Silveira]|eukprot:XP_003069518.1 hypothetical protein CPC735_027090 [Coccidioides posadasii C735 delta SOWgp]
MNPSKTRITPNSFLTKVGSSKDGDPVLVYFIPGNPGVVSYYHYFLSLVASNLSSSSPSDAFASLASAQLEKRTGSHEGDGDSTPRSSGSSTRSGHNSSDESPIRKLKIAGRKKSKKGTGTDSEKSDHESLSSRKRELWNYPNTNSDESFIITGRSLAGFEIEDASSYISSYLTTFSSTDTIHSLSSQVEYVESNLAKFVRKYQDKITTAATAVALAAGQEKDAVKVRKPRPKVILLGHSMGAYISMELLRRRREREKARATREKERNGPLSDHSNSDGEEDVEMDIIGALMLFPAVVDIAKSPSGKRMTTLGYIPWLDVITSLAVKSLISVTPAPVIRRWVRHTMKDPPEDALDTTIAFLKSRTGIRQALHLAVEEMEQIGPDKWSDEIWGISEQNKPSDDVESHLTKLVFYFGRNDHWVAEKTRDEIIQARSSKGGRGPKMIVCDDGIEHGFCIRHNEIMADKVSGFIRDIINDYRARK